MLICTCRVLLACFGAKRGVLIAVRLFLCYNEFQGGDILSNKVYDVLKWIVMIVLPALSTFYGALAGIWALPYAEAVPSTISAVCTLLGACLMVSSKNYSKTTITEETK